MTETARSYGAIERLTTVFICTGLALAMLAASPLEARTVLKNICRVKGQEENTLHGLGLVVGLAGTGDSGDYLPTMRALARSMELMGNPVNQTAGLRGRELLELKDTKNVALVWVTATVPAAGGRRGDQIDCNVSAISAKSLAGGRLVFSALQGPNVNDARIYALCQGRVHLDDINVPTEGRVHRGARLEEDIFNVYQKDGKITLVLDQNYADFQVAADVAEMINDQWKYQSSDSFRDGYLAHAIDAANVEVTIPAAYQDDVVLFVAQVLSMQILEPQTEARVVINERSGSIVVGEDVEIGSVVVTHKNIVVETGQPTRQFVALESGEDQSPKLKSLVEALDALKVPPQDKIDIIKGLERAGKLHARLIIE